MRKSTIVAALVFALAPLTYVPAQQRITSPATTLYEGARVIVGDGTRRDPRLLLWRRRNGGIEGPRVLARHGGSSHVQITHVHPRLSPDGGRILYVSDESGYGNLYLADLPDFEGLPPHPAARLPATRRASSRARSMIARWRRRVRAIAP